MSPNGESISFPMRLVMAGVSGGIGGIVGAPADMVNVRMQNDIKLPKDSPDRRNYKHAIDGLIRVMREEGLTKVPFERFFCRFIVTISYEHYRKLNTIQQKTYIFFNL